MESNTLRITNKVRWADLLTQYKYRPSDLLLLVNSSETVRTAVENSLVAWRVVLVALVETAIGSIWAPDLRNAAHEELLSEAVKWGVTRTAIRMTSVEIDSPNGYGNAGIGAVRGNSDAIRAAKALREEISEMARDGTPGRYLFSLVPRIEQRHLDHRFDGRG